MSDEKRKDAAKKLLAAAHEFWKACCAEGQYGAVQWVTDDTGALLIFTRGEYRPQLMENIMRLGGGEGEHRFAMLKVGE